MIAAMVARRIPNNRFTRLILVTCALVLVSVLAQPFLTSQHLRKDLGAMVAAQQMALANYVARDVDYKLTERHSVLTHIAAKLPIALMGHPAQLRQWLAEQHRLQPLFTQGLLVTDTAGRPLADHPHRPANMHLRYGEQEFIRRSLAGEVAVGRPWAGHVATSEPVLPMSAPVKDASGTVRAVLVGMTGLRAPGFLSLNPQNQTDENSDFMLISPRDQLFVASTQPDLVLQPTPPSGVDALVDRAMGGYRGSGMAVNEDGVEEVAAIASVPSTGWFVVARNPSAEAFHAMDSAPPSLALARLPMMLALLLMAATGLIFAIQPHIITHRLGHLSTPIHRLLTRLQPNPSKMAHMAHHDALTGLPNRALLADRLDRALARAHRHGKRVGLLTIDLDHFKSINSALGNDAGDAALMEVARRLEAIVRESDTLARVGGDQFAVVMEELDEDRELAELAACAVAAKCLDAVLPAITLKGSAHQLGASAGIALSEGIQGQDALQTASHHALQEAKRAGGDRYFIAAAPAMPASPAMASA